MSKFSLSLQSLVVHGAVGTLCMGPDFPFHQEEITFYIFYKYDYLVIGDNAWLPQKALRTTHSDLTLSLPY